ncbi:MAG: UpxY family transcription antiterminator [Bacteroidota bacterium]|jgi:transcriptional antiterminator RfaH|nr:UpxY family transcription antiterminator [Bacteroidota bacterium]MCA6441992.1 UpxY family transcription antiterminator [Bacteroidota bacterium]
MNWRALYVQSKRERKIVNRLIKDGIEAYIPLKTELKQWSDRKKMVTTPMLNGYVFVRLPNSKRDRVYEVEGVLNYVRYNGADAIVRDNEIEVLKMIEERGYYVEYKNSIDINVGDLVEIKAGRFKGLNGIVEKIGNKTHCFVVIKSLDFQFKLKLNKEVLQRS